MTEYLCKHHDRQERTNTESHWRLCGCDGSVHMACDLRPAPSGTPRPAAWPIFRSWITVS